MTPEQIEQERAAFEAWTRDAFPGLDLVKLAHNGEIVGFTEPTTIKMFAAWLARAEQGGWISVADKLPGKCDFYLVWDNIEKSRFEACFIPEKQVFRCQGEDITEYVTHWQPLTKPPAGAPA